MKLALRNLIHVLIILSLSANILSASLVMNEAPVSALEALQQAQPPDPMARVRTLLSGDSQSLEIDALLADGAGQEWAGTQGELGRLPTGLKLMFVMPFAKARAVLLSSDYTSQDTVKLAVTASDTYTTTTPAQIYTVHLPIVVRWSNANSGTLIQPEQGGVVFSPEQNVLITFRPDGLPEAALVSVMEDDSYDLPVHFILMGPKMMVKAVWVDDHLSVTALDPAAQPLLQPGGKPVPQLSQYWATVTFHLLPGQEGNDNLAIARLDPVGRYWEILSTQVDPQLGIATAETDRVGVFALVENAALWVEEGYYPSAATGNDVIVDDLDVDRFTRHEYDDSNDYWWPVACGQGGCWEGHAWWTWNHSEYEPTPPEVAWNWADWRPNLPQSGYYYVDAWIPAADANTSGARYQIHHSGQVDDVTINQAVNGGRWLTLEAFYFAANGEEYVQLDDVVPETWELGSRIGFDAIRFVYYGQEPPPPVDRVPPVIHSVDRFMSNGLSNFRTTVTDNVAVALVSLIFNGQRVDMTPVGGDVYEATVSVPLGQISTWQVVAVDTNGNVAVFPTGTPFDMRGYLSRNLGLHRSICGGSDSCNLGDKAFINDPVITDPTTGNFVYPKTDLTIAGIGDADIIIERTYNPMPNEPQGVIRYTPDGDQVIEEPLDVHPEPFGPGWSFLPSLLVLDNALLHGVQVRYPDGHTADFVRSGASFTPSETRVWDTLSLEGSGYLLTLKDLTQYHFDSEGRLTRITDRNGNAINYFYDGDRLVRIENSAGRWATLEYNGEGYVSDIYAPESIHLQYGYVDGQLTSFTDGRDETWQYVYEGGRMTALITPEGHPALRLTYDDLGRTIEQIEGATERYTLTYSDDNRTTTITDIYGNQVVHVYDEKQRLIESRNAAGSEYFRYDDQDQRIYYQDRAGNEWWYTYSAYGNRLTEDGPLSWHREWEYNGLNLVIRYLEQVDESQTRQFTFDYNGQGNLIELCNPYDCGTIKYDDLGQPTKTWDFARNPTINTYDPEGDLIAVTNAMSETISYGHDDLGRMTDLWTPLDYHYSYAYDGSSNLTDVNGPLGYYLGFRYDKNGNLKIEIDPNQGETEYFYDASENLVRVENQLNFPVAIYGYGLMNELTDFEDGEGRLWTYGHDALLRVTDIYGPEDTHTHIDYDAVDNITDVTDLLERVTHMVYDNLYRPISVTLNYRPGEPEDADTNVTTTYKYDLLGNVLQVTDPELNSTEYTYDLLGRVLLVRDAEEQEWEYAYYPMGNVKQIINPREFPTNFEYDSIYRLYKVIDAQENITTFEYDDDGNLTARIDPLGVVTHYDYNELDRPVREILNYRPDLPSDSQTNVATEYEYDLAGNLRFVTEPRLYRAEFRYDDAMRLVDIFDFEGAHTHLAYDKVDNLLSATDDNTHTTTYTYTDLDNVETITNPETHTIHLFYDKAGNLTDVVDANTNPTHYEYDALDRLVYVLDALQGEWSYEYDRVGNVLVETDANRHIASYTYDDVYRLLTVTDAEENVSEFRWDENSNLVEFIDGNTHSTWYDYDELDRLEFATNAELETTEYRYDALGNQTHLIEADGTVALYGYDPLYRLASVTENFIEGQPGNNDTNVVTHYTYDPSSNLAQFINANNAPTSFEYDGMGRVVRETNPLDNQWNYTYDGVGNLLTRLDANGDLTTYAYYDDDMLRRIEYGMDNTGVEFTYDANNNRTSMADWLGETTWVYDALNRLTDQVDPFGRPLHYDHDPVGNRVGMRYPDGNYVGYTYYDNDWLKTMVDPESNVTSYDRDGVGNITRILYPNSVVATLTYDQADRVLTLINQQTVGAKETIAAFDYTYNDVGHVTQVVSQYGWRNPPVVTENFTYDGLHRLSGMSDSDGVVMSYAYDKVGNRLSWTTNDDLTTQTPWDGFSATYAYNAANQLTTASIDSVAPNEDLTVDFAYDNNGNRVNKETSDRNGPIYGTDYSYDPENRLIVAQDYQLVDHGNRIDRAITTLEYDGGGRRLVSTYDPKIDPNVASASTGAGITGVAKRIEYVFDGLDPVAEYSMLNGQRDNYYRGAGGRIMTMQHFQSGSQGQMFWYQYNFKGDVVGLTKQHGQSTHNYRYDPYGGVVPANGNFVDPHNHYTLTGKEFDENTELVYFGARHYDPQVGTWVTQDVHRGDIKGPPSLHRYQYVYDNPISYYDYMGFVPREGKATSSCNCGIIDWSHVDAGNANSLANRIYDGVSSGKKEFTIDTKSWYVFGGTYQIVITKDNLTDTEKVEIAYGIFRELSWRYEETQWLTQYLPRQSSYFPAEDLPSDTMSFYANVLGYDIEALCNAPLMMCTQELDLSKYNYNLWQSWEADLSTGLRCNAVPKWPSEFGTINPNYSNWYIKGDENNYKTKPIEDFIPPERDPFRNYA